MIVVLSFAKIKKVSKITKIIAEKVVGAFDFKKQRYFGPLLQSALLDLYPSSLSGLGIRSGTFGISIIISPLLVSLKISSTYFTKNIPI